MASKKKYQWNFANIGGSTRVKITSGEDIAHLGELDPKMWTVLSCPSTGLEIDNKSLQYIDSDKDGIIRVNDIVATANWMAASVKNNDLLLAEKDNIDIECFNQESESGKKLHNSAKQILKNLGKEGTVITLADTCDMAAIFAQTRFNGDGIITEISTDDADEKAAITAAIATFSGVADRSGATGINAEIIEKFYTALADYNAWQEARVEAPFGTDTDKAIEVYNALDSKVKDYFLRNRLAGFSPESTGTLDVQTSRIESISADNLTGKTDEIASFPIARITGKATLELNASINPAWADKFHTLISIIQPQKEFLEESDWAEIGSKFTAYTAWKSSPKGLEVEKLGLESVKKLLQDDKKQALLELVAKDSALAEDFNNIEVVNKFLHIYRDFYRLLRNFVTFEDFYKKDKKITAMFQSGRLIIDQRECRLCMNVTDMAKHNSSAASSGIYLVYCDCTNKILAKKQQIVAAVTVGNIGDLIVGKNAIYYDNSGMIWDAVITKIIDNPISISQAFWSPYRRTAVAIEKLINKNAADKDAALMKDVDKKISAAPAATAPTDEKKAAQPFDIGKFAGIFAAIGMAVGMIATALSDLAAGLFTLTWWQFLMVFVGIILLVSGPSMVMAWLKLRRRNIAPLLNANGWAINASSRISIPFGETLTDTAQFPKLKLKDPYAKKGLAPWKKWCLSIATLVVVVLILWLVNLLSWAGMPSPLNCFQKETVEVVETVAATEETTPEATAPAEEVAQEAAVPAE
ncbi:MAG: hypothetical protein IJZ86_07850 [Bacteroides sp.]|nr:hypothetical protein [Bacteroides sp.]